jgi:Transglycosylase SLT domain
MPDDYGPIYQAAGHQWGIDPLLLQSMAEGESNQNPNATGPVIKSGPAAGTQAQGIMQFVPQTAAQYGVDTSNPTNSIYGASNYMSHLMMTNKGDLRQSLADYGGTVPGSSYVKGVINRYTQLSNDWGSGGGGTPQAPAPATPPARTATTTFAPGDDDKATLLGLQPHVDENGAPLPSATPPSAEPADPGVALLQGLTPHVDENGAPVPTSSGQFLSNPTSPSAKAVGTTIAEGRVPDQAFQAAINWSTDPAQRARTAAHLLYPNDPNALDRIIIGPEGRMAATDDQGKPYFIEPQRQPPAGMTREAQPGQTLLSQAWSGYEPSPQTGPASPWTSLGAMAVNPYSTNSVAQAWWPSSWSPSNLLQTAGADAPSFAQNVLQMGASAFGPLPTGLATAGTELGRQAVANWLLDPNPAEAPPLDWHKAYIDARNNALMSFAGTKLLEGPPAVQPAWGGPRWLGEPYWPEGGAAAEAGGAAPEVTLNPLGDAAEPSGPYAASTPEAVAAIPNSLPTRPIPVQTKAQAEDWADQILQHVATGGPVAADVRELIPGHQGSLAQITGNPGIATFERWVRNQPWATNVFGGVDQAQRVAGQRAVAGLQGSGDALAAGRAQVEANTQPLKDAAFANTTPTDPSGVVAEFDDILSGPEGKRPDVAGPLRQLRDGFYKTDPATGKPAIDPVTGAPTLETDPLQLYGARRAITDSLKPMARSDAPDARAAAREIQTQILPATDKAIEAGAPGFRNYMDQYHQESLPWDAMEYLQGRNLTDANGYPTLAKVDAMIKNIEAQRNLQRGVRPADALSDDQMTTAYNLRDALRQQANLGKGKAWGSNTAQNLAGGQTLNAFIGQGGEALGTSLGGAAGWAFGGAEWPGLFVGNAVGKGTQKLVGFANARSERLMQQALLDRLTNKNGLGVKALAGMPGANVPPAP